MRGSRRGQHSSQREFMTLGSAAVGREYRVRKILRPQSDSAWKATQVRLTELGIWPGQTVEKSGSAGPGCPIILKVGGSRVALSPDLCDLIIVSPTQTENMWSAIPRKC